MRGHAESGCYRVEWSANDDGSVTMATLCHSQRVLGHYVRMDAGQAAQLCKFLCDHVPGVAEAVLGKLVEM